MHKKVQSLIITGIMLTNIFTCAGAVFADSNLETTKANALLLKDADSIINEGGKGGSAKNPAVLRINTLEGLKHVLSTIVNSGPQMAFSRLGDSEDIDQNTVMYKLHVVDGTYGYYVNIKLDKSETELTDLLNQIPKVNDDEDEPLEDIVDMEEGDGTSSNPYKVRVNTVEGLNKLLNNYNTYYRTENITDIGIWDKEYEICVVSKANQITHINVIVDSYYEDVVDALNKVTTEIPKEPSDQIDPVIPEQPDVNTNPPTEEVKPSLPSIHDKIDAEVVNLVGNGDGQVNNPLILEVKSVTTTKLNEFLNGLNDLSPKITSISRGEDYTEYKIEVDNSNISITRILKMRSTSKTIYVTIKADNDQNDLVKALNKFARGTNANLTIPSIVKFNDVAEKFWARAGIEDFASMGLINGYSDKTFKPNNSITRAEFVKIINNAFGYTQKGDVKFSDVKPKDWFYNEVAIAVKAGYINGKSETTFAPNDKITRQEVSKILTTIMKNKNTDYDELEKFPDGTKVSDWAKPYVEGAIKAGYLSGDTNGKLNPTNNITRAEAVTVLSRIKK